MIESKNSVAKKYAVAFLDLYSDQLTLDDMQKISNFEFFLKDRGYFYVSLSIPGILFETKEFVVSKMIKFFGLKECLKNLIILLLKSGRIDILDLVLKNIWNQYKKIKNIESFKIMSSHSLSQAEKDIAEKTLNNFLHKKVLTQFLVDPSLIVGLRMESLTLLWERSIRKELIEAKKIISKKGLSCV
ncbi:TPA: hypothetical protein DEO28_02360 [Candidatus Dependentiae bacterium]|nr:MAG: ATP synthase subunit delta [candidate division TM6 bacterium GW2011_GWE2_31_21]KKP53236.1 MAG: ATP synthase subunit delta [candidate division TM6 bacterium GW2011_GWF2_33_332]HBS48065.1 hypothetical protein [Candidatus Dependentiae bacterium]HBZ73332.1 hypothetical protein [Candidatus Dependentiae bacterium]